MSNATKVVLNYVPRPWQAECHAIETRFMAISTHRRAGKSIWSVMEALDWALHFGSEDGLFVHLGCDSRLITLPLVERIVRPLVDEGAVTLCGGELTLKHNSTRILFRGHKDARSFYGCTINGVVVDEAAQMLDVQAWEEVLQPALDGTGRAAFISTIEPPPNVFHTTFAHRGPDWTRKCFTVEDTGLFTAAELNVNGQLLSKQAFAREFMCKLLG